MLETLRRYGRLSQHSLKHLADTAVPDRGENPTTADMVAAVLYRFVREHRAAFKTVPSGTDGARINLANEQFILLIDEVWNNAHDLTPPARGWPEFRNAFLAPLHEYGMPREESALKALLLRAKKRKAGTAK